jgi:hypothetical protein
VVTYAIFQITPTDEVSMPKAPMFKYGEQVIVTDPVDNHFKDMTGEVRAGEFRSYLNDYVYYVLLDQDGYEMEFEAMELTLEAT